MGEWVNGWMRGCVTEIDSCVMYYNIGRVVFAAPNHSCLLCKHCRLGGVVDEKLWVGITGVYFCFTKELVLEVSDGVDSHSLATALSPLYRCECVVAINAFSLTCPPRD
eukprot:TsM_000359900 transcript=TsM_000359900 gene=TsM_000359900